MRGITKRFSTVLANDQLDFDIYPGEVHALLGENGAGKSTLMKILYGFYQADSGQILFNGRRLEIRTPQDARRAQIGMVFQQLNLIPAMSVAENIALFLQDLPAVYDPKAVQRRIATFSQQYGLTVDPHDLVSQLSIGEQQKVEIVKLLLSDARLLILDEPTRVLAPHEIEALYEILERLRGDGYAIVLITHKMKDVLRCANRITVLRAGRIAGTLPARDVTEAGLVALMFDNAVAGTLERAPRPNQPAPKPIVELRQVYTRGDGAATRLKDINLAIGQGEIIGVAGVSGNGQRELGDVVLGMEPVTRGQKWWLGQDCTHWPVGALRRAGLGFIPENPLTMATVPFMTVLENMALTGAGRYARRGGLRMDWPAVQKDLRAALARFGFSFSPYALARSLSGGNLQRLIIAREMVHRPKLIIASYPTSGLDVQSATVARQALVQARNDGAGVLLISEDLDELFSLSDRLVVLFGGAIAGEFKPAETDPYTVGRLMTGSSAQPAGVRP
jgi:simple sugar transport system ATP-binding protein